MTRISDVPSETASLRDLLPSGPGDESRSTQAQVATLARDFLAYDRAADVPHAALTHGALVRRLLGQRTNIDATPAEDVSAREEIAALHMVVRLQAERISELETLVTTDTLTGLLNRRGFELEFARALAFSARHTPVHGIGGVVIFIDLDGFKSVNDAFGHLAGDAVLREVGRQLAAHARASDAIARIGGDEFAALLPDTDRLDGVARAEELSALINSTVVAWRGQTIRVRASAGIQTYHNGEDPVELIAKADAAMYRIKRLRDREAATDSASRWPASRTRPVSLPERHAV